MLSPGSPTTVCQLTSMDHPMHRAHQEDISPGSEEWLKARRATLTRLVEFIFRHCFK